MRFVSSTALMLTALLCACQRPGPSPTDLWVAPLPSRFLANPVRIEGELVVEISNIRPLSGQRLIADNRTRGVPADQAPELHIWSSQIVDRFTQQSVEMFEVSPPPDDAYDDPVNGNRILHWDLTRDLAPGNSVTLRRHFAYTCYEFHADIDSEEIRTPNTDSALYRWYTRPERLIECDSPEIRDLAARIVEGESNPVWKARRIFQWVCDNLDYHYPPGERGALATLERCSGDCGEYSLLFVALCRAAGVPARLVSGFMFRERTGYHAWAEFHVPGYGWLPADASIADDESGQHDFEHYFANLPADRLIASVGTNLPIRPSVDWARWQNSEIDVNVTDFMQLWTQAGCGFDASFSTELNVIDVEPIEIGGMTGE